MSSNRVHVGEIAEVLHWSEAATHAKLESMGVKLAPDWAGRPSLTVPEASRAYRRVIAEVNSARAEELARQAKREREEQSQAAAESSLASNIRVALRRRGHGDPVLYSAVGRALERLRRGEPADMIEREVVSNVDAR